MAMMQMSMQMMMQGLASPQQAMSGSQRTPSCLPALTGLTTVRPRVQRPAPLALPGYTAPRVVISEEGDSQSQQASEKEVPLIEFEDIEQPVVKREVDVEKEQEDHCAEVVMLGALAPAAVDKPAIAAPAIDAASELGRLTAVIDSRNKKRTEGGQTRRAAKTDGASTTTTPRKRPATCLESPAERNIASSPAAATLMKRPAAASNSGFAKPVFGKARAAIQTKATHMFNNSDNCFCVFECLNYCRNHYNRRATPATV